MAEDMGITYEAASARAAHLRGKGVALKRMPRKGSSRYDYDALKSLV